MFSRLYQYLHFTCVLDHGRINTFVDIVPGVTRTGEGQAETVFMSMGSQLKRSVSDWV